MAKYIFYKSIIDQMKNSATKTIHVLCPLFYPAIGGMETNILEVYSTLVKKGWKVVVHTSKNISTHKGDLPIKETIRGITVRRYKSSNFGFSPKIDWVNLDILSLHNFDFFTYSKIFLYIWFLKLINRKKFSLIITPHCNLTPARQWFSPISFMLRKIIYRSMGSFLISRSVDGIRTVSTWEKKKLVAMGIRPSIIKTITNGIEKAAFSNFDKRVSSKIKQKVNKLGSYIIQVGRISREKNYETAIKAMQFVPRNIKYVIVGPIKNKRYYHYLKSLAQKIKLNNRVTFWGKIDIYSKYYLIKHAKLMVHMSLSEAFGNAVHEGMSQGLPCIVSNSTALPDLIKNNINGFCLDPKDHKALAEKIIFVLDKKNKKIIQRIRETNIKVTKNKTWNSVALKVEEFYKNVQINTSAKMS